MGVANDKEEMRRQNDIIAKTNAKIAQTADGKDV